MYTTRSRIRRPSPITGSALSTALTLCVAAALLVALTGCDNDGDGYTTGGDVGTIRATVFNEINEPTSGVAVEGSGAEGDWQCATDGMGQREVQAAYGFYEVTATLADHQQGYIELDHHALPTEVQFTLEPQ